MTDTATQPGVDEAELVIGNIERNETIERIAKSARELRDKEMQEEGQEVVDTSGGEPENKEEVQAIDPEPETEQAQKVEEPAERMIRVKVDGVEKEVPESLILDAGVRAVQKESAADKRLAEATQLLNQAREATRPKPLPDMDEVELSNRIRRGTDEEAEEAISILQGRNQATPDQIAEAVEQRVLKNIEFKEAGKWFVETYKDIVADPYLTNLAIAEETRLRDSGDERDFKAIYKDIGDNITKKLVEWRVGKVTVSTSTDKQERKAEINNLHSASARMQSKEQPKPKTPTQIIDEMRKARGQVV